MKNDDLASPLRVACILDPAIDWTRGDPAAYVDTRDPALLTEKPGMRIRWATIRTLTLGQFLQIDALSTPQAKLLQSFRVACTAVEHVQQQGHTLLPTAKVHVDGAAVTTWGEEELGVLMRELGARYVIEIGNVAYERALRGKAWTAGERYTLPHSSVVALDQIGRQRAAQNPRSGGTGSSERSRDDSTPTPDGTSDAAGGARAESGPTPPAAQ